MNPTRPAALVLAAATGLALGLFIAVLGRRGDLFSLPVGVPATLALVAVAEWVVGTSVRQRLDGTSGARSLDPTAVPPIAALAKASSLTGAFAAGTWLSLLVDRLLQSGTVDAATRDAVVAGFGLATAALLVPVALRLESACRSWPE